MIDHDSIKFFVQKTPGCGCPEEVFRSIDCRFCVRLRNEAAVNCAFIVGNRLLVYVVDDGDVSLDEKRLALYLAEGTKERDSKGLNRFRLVIATDTAWAQQRLKKAFEALNNEDEKVHLHVISREKNIFAEGGPRKV